MKYSLYLIGYVFVALVSLYTAMMMTSPWLQLLLIVSAIISLALCIATMLDSKKSSDKIKELENKSKRAVYAGPVVGEAPEIDSLYLDPNKSLSD